MVALVEFPFMATLPGITFHGAIPNRCLSVTTRQPPGHEVPNGLRTATPSNPDTTSHPELPVDLSRYIDALPPPHAADAVGRGAAGAGVVGMAGDAMARDPDTNLNRL
jgi:hypothetical protein